ncbi:PGF-CTERM sorting domain-containing protein [Natrarchaeobius halalkaliphilus]|uniref:PGF-CTERM sorting domain-containing protein n=1 Tax=Natrarchaeobius halalkaliphilus TaxID=1679091 RepID=A0A3N6LZX6_9EURY|nr:BGTF surface domain-containing protein [Natrarchaeobius halalkaliphilus]RQG88880.1 PGF-CTERM sorting domain-containing protein [Natrarchaeobius halalkaliphilus]
MSENSYREKGRAVFLAAIMVLSVVAMSVAFAGGAAAADADLDSGSTNWQGQELAITDVSDSASSEIASDEELQIREYEGDDDVGGLENEFSLDENESVVETDGLEAGDYVITLAGDRDSAVKLDGGVADEITDASDAYFEITSQDLDVSIDASEVNNGANSETELDVDSNRGTYSVVVSADGDLGEEDLFAIFVDNDSVDSGVMSTIGAESVDDLYDAITDDTETDVSTVYDNLSPTEPGAEFGFGEFNASVYDDEDDQIVLNDIDDRAADLDFDGIGEDEYDLTFEVADSTAEDSASIEVLDEDVDVEFDQTVYTQTAGDVVEFTIEFEDTDDAFVQFGDEDAGYVDILYIEDSEDDGEVTVQVNTRAVGVNSDADTGDVYDAGDDTVESMIIEHGGETDGDFEAVEFTDEDGDKLDASNAEHHLDEYVDELGLGDDAEEQLVRPLQATDYDLAINGMNEFTVTDDGESELGNELDLATLDLTPPGVDSIDTYVAPSNDANAEDDLEEVLDTVTQRTDIAADDQLIIKAEATGLFGALVYEEEDFGALEGGFSPETLGNVVDDDDWEGDGITFDVTADDATGNQEATSLKLDDDAEDGAVFVLADNEAGELYVIVDTSSSDAFDSSIDDGMDFTAELEYESHPDDRYVFDGDSVEDAYDGGANGDDPAYPYFLPDTVQSVSTDFTIVEPEVTFENLDEDDNVQLETSDEFEITGETNVAPGSDASVRITNAGDTPSFLHTLEDTEIDSDGYFATEPVDFSDRDEGDEGELDFRIGGSGIDTADALFVDQIEDDDDGADDDDDDGADDDGTDDDGTDDGADDDGTDDGADDDGADDDSDDGADDDSDDTVPGFGVAVALVALLAAAMLALRRQH